MELFLSEFLGRIWRILVPLDATGRVNWNSMDTPQLIVDQSTFSASVILRQTLQEVREAGKPRRDVVFYEVSG